MIYSTQDALGIARPTRTPGGAVRDRLRDHDAADRGRAQGRARRGARKLLGVLQSRADAAGDHPCLRTILGQRRSRTACNSTASSGRPTSAPSSAAGPTNSCRSEFGKPVVIAGFEPLDVMQSALMLVRQINQGRCTVENQYTRAVTATATARPRR
jgi:hypothetical protein